MVQEGGGDVTMLAAPVTLQDSGVKEKPQEEATLQVGGCRYHYGGVTTSNNAYAL